MNMKSIRHFLLALVCLCMLTVFGSSALASADTYACTGVDIYLALRTAKAFDANNEIGKIYPGETVEVLSYEEGDYWYVYAPILNRYGYVNKNYLKYAGGSAAGGFRVKVNEGYLALRTEKAFDAANEIGKLYTGDTVQVIEANDPQYWYVYTPKLNAYGYVNRDYIYYDTTVNLSVLTVKVKEGYLALRTAKAFDAANEIGKLYTGDVVYLQDAADPQYWYVYSPLHDKYGYVNKDFVFGSPYNAAEPKTVSVAEGYLALRTAMAYDAANEIGKLYNGETVFVQSKTTDSYWYVYAPTLNKFGYVNREYLK